jgi:cell division septation protein DedD
LEGFAVQVGAFRDEDKLSQAREKLAFAGISHYVERRGDLNRLRAGPYSTREAAEKALAAVKATSLEGQVVPLP